MGYRTQETSSMGYTSIGDKIKWWYPHTKKLKYCSSTKFDKHNNKILKVRSPGYEIMNGANISTLPTLEVDISDHTFIKYDIF